MLDIRKPNLDKIVLMQHDLNKIIGRDTINDPNKQQWEFEYAFAMYMECVELLDCVDWKWWSKTVKENPSRQFKSLLDRKNAKIEIIDIIHFFISLCHINNIKTSVMCEYINQPVSYTPNEVNIFTNTINLIDLVDIGFIFNNRISSFHPKTLLKMYRLILWICDDLGMSEDDIMDVYEKKWKVNIERQNKNYDVRYKTEDDNENIKTSL